MNENVLAKALQSLVDHGITQASGEKLIVNAGAWEFLNKRFTNAVPEPIKPTYEIEVDFND